MNITWDLDRHFVRFYDTLLNRVMPWATERSIALAPHVERWAWDLVELAFGFKRATQQLVLAGCLQSAILGWQVLRRRKISSSKSTSLPSGARVTQEQRFEISAEAMAHAKSYEEWLEKATALDAMDGSLDWRATGGGGERLVDAVSLRLATKRLRRLAYQSSANNYRANSTSAVHAAMYAVRGGALLGRDAHGLAEAGLYERARSGAPRIVEQYLDAAVSALDAIENTPDDTVPTEARLAFFNECRHAHGRTALLLSGGAGLGIYHLGVVSALRDAKLLPRVISGASAGSIVAATICCRNDIEMAAIFSKVAKDEEEDDDYISQDYHVPPSDASVKSDTIFRLDFFRWKSSQAKKQHSARSEKSHTSTTSSSLNKQALLSSIRKSRSRVLAMAPPNENLMTDLSKACPEEDDEEDTSTMTSGEENFHRFRVARANSSSSDVIQSMRDHSRADGSIMCGDHLARVIRSNVGGDLTFQEAFDKTGKILNIPVREHDAEGEARRIKASAPPRLLNYLTAPHVVVWSASRASCAVPGVFAPSPLLVRCRDGALRYEDEADDNFDEEDQNCEVFCMSDWEQQYSMRGGKSGAYASKRNKGPVRTLYVDGSMGADLPMETMRTLFNCNHFLCSQTNVHAALLGDSALRLVGAVAPGVRHSTRRLKKQRGLIARSATALLNGIPVFDATHAVLIFVKSQLKAWVKEGIACLAELSTAAHADSASASPNYSTNSLHPHNRRNLWERLVPWQLGSWALSVLTQPYEGRAQDVTLVPFAGHLGVFDSFSKTLINPERGASISDIIDAGKRNTWRELSKIRDHCCVERVLEQAVQRLRARLYREHNRKRGIPSSNNTPRLFHMASGAKLPTVDGKEDALGRTPSFYTSSSMLQLSGLAVVDPVTIESPTNSRLSLHRIDDTARRSASSENIPTLRTFSSSSLGGHGDIVNGSSDSVGLVIEDEGHVLQPETCKTSSMANFYYRDFGRTSSLQQPVTNHSTTATTRLRASHSDDGGAYTWTENSSNEPSTDNFTTSSD